MIFFKKLFPVFFSSILFFSCATNPHYPTKFDVNENVEPNPYISRNFIRRNKVLYYHNDPRYITRHGIDISHHDGDVDWEQVRNDGREFAFIRVGYRGYQSGLLNLDRCFHNNMKNAIEAGLDVGVYIFSQAISEQEAIEEAEFVLDQIREYTLTLPVVYDPETISWDESRTDDLTSEQIMLNTKAFCQRIKAAGYEPMIYSNLKWEVDFFNLEELAEYKIWYADYRRKPKTPYHYEFLQYSGESEKVNGVGRKCDGDIQFIRVE